MTSIKSVLNLNYKKVMTNLLALDVGTKRIGVATAETTLPIAVPLETIEVDGNEVETIRKIVHDKSIEKIIVGFPRNQGGEPTAQTEISEQFALLLRGIAQIEFQDESLTSVLAEDRLKMSGKPYKKSDIDALAAAMILQDYLELHHA